jgi:predicted Zn-dependent peptidase
MVMARVGSRYEAADQRGIAHFVEHLVFKGTTRRPTSLDITSAIDAIGGEFNAFTSKEYTGFYIKAAAKDAALCLDMLGDMLHHSRFDPVEIDRERGVILEEMNLYLDSPHERVSELYERVLFGDQPLGWEVIGSRQTVSQLRREQLAEFATRWYAPNNMVVGVAGNFDQTEVIGQTEAVLGQPSPANLTPAPPLTGQQAQPRWHIQAKDTDQTHVVVGFPGLPIGHPDRYALALLNCIIGGTMSSRLFVEVREKRGLAYAVHTGVEEFHDAGSFHCQLGLDINRLPEALTVILQQFGLVRRQGVSDLELQRAKSYLGGRLALSLEDPLGMIHFSLKQQLLEQQWQTPSEMLEQVQRVTLDDVQRVATSLIQTDRLNLAIIGPVIDEQAVVSRLSLE